MNWKQHLVTAAVVIVVMAVVFRVGVVRDFVTGATAAK
jgi:hypothetical protein